MDMLIILVSKGVAHSLTCTGPPLFLMLAL